MDTSSVHVERYSLATALCMIIGICIGSGIFFKSDNVLIATGGNVALGVLMFCLAATTIIFGGLTLSRFAMRTNGHGGTLAYAREYLKPWQVSAVGWHYTFLYMPAVTAVVCWVVGVYACLAFGMPSTLPVQVGIGIVFMVLCCTWNVLWPTISGYAQNLATLAKVAPLVIVGLVGLAAGNAGPQLSLGVAEAGHASPGWIAAAAPIAFAFDGWSSAVSIAPELKNARRNLPRALIIGPILILVLYLAYFLGLTSFLGPQTVMRAGDASLSLMFVRMFGPQAATLPNVIALIAVMGTANGMILAMLRMPYALALAHEVPFAKQIATVHPTLKFPVNSALLALGVSLIMMAVHATVTAANLLPNGDISEVGVALTMLLLTVFYARALTLKPEGKRGSLRVFAAPIIALASSVCIGLVSLSDPTRWPFVVVHILILVLATQGVSRMKRAATPRT